MINVLAVGARDKFAICIGAMQEATTGDREPCAASEAQGGWDLSTAMVPRSVATDDNAGAKTHWLHYAPNPRLTQCRRQGNTLSACASDDSEAGLQCIEMGQEGPDRHTAAGDTH